MELWEFWQQQSDAWLDCQGQGLASVLTVAPLNFVFVDSVSPLIQQGLLGSVTCRASFLLPWIRL